MCASLFPASVVRPSCRAGPAPAVQRPDSDAPILPKNRLEFIPSPRHNGGPACYPWNEPCCNGTLWSGADDDGQGVAPCVDGRSSHPRGLEKFAIGAAGRHRGMKQIPGPPRDPPGVLPRPWCVISSGARNPLGAEGSLRVGRDDRPCDMGFLAPGCRGAAGRTVCSFFFADLDPAPSSWKILFRRPGRVTTPRSRKHRAGTLVVLVDYHSA